MSVPRLERTNAGVEGARYGTALGSGRTLYYKATPRRLMAADVTDGTELTLSEPRELFSGNFVPAPAGLTN